MPPKSKCPHVTTLGDFSWDDVDRRRDHAHCYYCNVNGPNLWMCLHHDCFKIGCGEAAGDHSSVHNKENVKHCLHLNLSTSRIWCYLCRYEVFLNNNEPPVVYMEGQGDSAEDGDEEDGRLIEEETLKPRGLTGLQNIGNTCYMNSALQALSNTPPLAQFFLECSGVAFCTRDVSNLQQHATNQPSKHALTKSFARLIQQMWNENSGDFRRPSYVVPTSILTSIRSAHPMFRGYHQHDTQEFLRCFMDQLHEELKEPVAEYDKEGDELTARHMLDGGDSVDMDDILLDGEPAAASSSSQSEAEYETCDSGVSEVSDDSCGNKRRELRSNSTHIWKKNHGSLPPDVKKELKDNINQAHKQQKKCSASSEDIVLSSSPQAEFEFSDAMSDTPIVRSSRPSSPIQIPLLQQPVDRKVRSSLGRIRTARSQSPSSGRGSCQSPAPSMNSLKRKQPSSSGDGPASPKKPTKHHSIISDIFDGRIVSAVQCLTCDRVSTTVEAFQDLSLPIPNRDHLQVLHHGTLVTPQKSSSGSMNVSGSPTSSSSSSSGSGGFSSCSDMYTGHQSWISWMWEWMRSWFWGPTVSLHDCLSAFFSADELKGDNMYSCEKCHKLRNGIKYSRVLELPEVLCIHLKRFRHELMFSSKISSFVTFPLEGLDLATYLHRDCPAEVTTYNLVAVICHQGTAGGGHYTCYALNCINNSWYEFDDQFVTQVTPETVQNCEAYVLFYKKYSEEMSQRRERVMELMQRAQHELGLMHFYISKQWVNKFNTFSEPGPIDNSDFLCRHGAVHPNKVLFEHELCIRLPQSVWEYLHKTFGGGPACNCLYECTICRQQTEATRKRQKNELEEYMRLNREFQTDLGSSSAASHAISMSWFRKWEEFVRRVDDEWNESPGPIDNTPIVTANTAGSGQQLKIDSDFAQLSSELWQFFHKTYGGGPEVQLPQQQSPLSSLSSSGTGRHQRKAISTDNITSVHRPQHTPWTCSRSYDNVSQIKMEVVQDDADDSDA